MQPKRLIGLRGVAGSGKSLAATIIQQELQQTALLALADPIKELLYHVLDIPNDNLWGSSAMREKSLPQYLEEKVWDVSRERLTEYLPSWAHTVLLTGLDEVAQPLVDKIYEWFDGLRAETLDINNKRRGLTARRAAQTLGTECGRAVNENIWVNYGLSRAAQFQRARTIDNVVLTDVRFINEAKAIRDKEGQIWLLQREYAGLHNEGRLHKSEAEGLTDEIRKYDTYTIKNDSASIEVLRGSIKQAIRETLKL